MESREPMVVFLTRESSHNLLDGFKSCFSPRMEVGGSRFYGGTNCAKVSIESLFVLLECVGNLCNAFNECTLLELG